MDMEIYGLRIFCQVVADKTFSEAARSLKLTQPTVSQQIAKLESVLGVRLFERVGHDVIPTPTAKELYRFACGLIAQVDDFTGTLQKKQALPEGKVRYAMPESCQWTPHFKKIMEQISAFPAIQFEIEILPNDLIAKGLLEAALDFGFIVGEKLASELRFEKFSDERYAAVALNKSLLNPLGHPQHDSLRLISYPGWEYYLEVWAKAHSVSRSMKAKSKEPTVKVGTLAGAIHAVQQGAGVAVLPAHCVAHDLESGRLLSWESKKGLEASSPIYLTRRGGEKQPRRVELVIEMLREAKAKLG